jgi:hypothetical protein
VLPPSRRGRSEITWEFTVIYPNPDMEVKGPGCGGEPANEDLGPWQSHMAWEYGTDWVAGFLAGKRRYVEGPRPANVGLWPIAHLRHPESDESGGEEGGNGRTPGAARTQGVTAPSRPVMAPPSIAPPVVATAVPTIPEGPTAAPSIIPTPSVAPTPVATAPSTVPTTQPAVGGFSTTTTTGAQLPRERPPTTEERHPKRAATEAAATLQLAAGGRPRGPAVTVAAEGSQADQQWEQARAEVQRLWAVGQQLQGEAQTKTTYTGFREVANIAQDALEAADAASRRARQERMASVGALSLTEVQLPGAPQKGSGRNGRRSGRGRTRSLETGGGDGRQGKSGNNAASRHAPASNAHPNDGGTSNLDGAANRSRAAAGVHPAHNGREAAGATGSGIGRPQARPWSRGPARRWSSTLE